MESFVGWVDPPKAEKPNENNTFLWVIDPFFYKIDRIHSFDIHYSTFDIRFFNVSFSIRLDAPRPEAALLSEFIREPSIPGRVSVR
jgi:hypothetical protein